jgi:tetratricopeptide (TPR) repeat protein
MPDQSATNVSASPLPRQLDQICDSFEAAWKQTLTGADRPNLEEYLGVVAGPERQALLRELLAVDIGYRRLLGETPTPQEYHERFPALPPKWLDHILTSAGGSDTLHTSTLTSGTRAAPPSLPGYEILGELGRGGMGVVYLARQVQLGRTVALKMILAGSCAADEDVRRFLAEAAAVAHLQHPNIVQLFESGQHNRLPFFALEYVDGGSLAALVRTAPLPAARAAQVVEQLARGMASAHGRGVVHRDLKPENVLLTSDGIAKIADFGLAKRAQAGPSLTNTGVIVGTPSYMAPEQASGQSKAAGPAADVYALGAILYRVLTGRPPFQAATALETVMQVLHSEPVPPTQLQPSVPRDLETICLKCLQKEPAKRYASASALADDLERFLRHEPILARPLGRWERLVKWARRRPAVAALSAALLALTLLVIGGLLIGIGLISAALTTAEKERDAKEEQRQIAVEAAHAESQAKIAEEAAKKALAKRLEQVTKAQEILKSIFVDLDPLRTEKDGPPLQARLGKRLDNAAKLLEEEAVGDPVDVAGLQLWLAKAQLSLGNHKSAVGLLVKARQTFERERGPDDRLTLNSMHDLAKAYKAVGELEKALPLFEETVAKYKLTLGPDQPDTLAGMSNLAAAYWAKGQLKKALPLFEHALEKLTLIAGPDDPQTLTTKGNLAGAYKADGQLKKALPLYEQSLAVRKVKLGPDHLHTLTSMGNLALAYKDDGQLKRALPLFEQTLKKLTLTSGPDHPYTLTAMNNLALAYGADGQVKKALSLFEQALEKHKRILDPDHPETLTCMNNLAGAYWADGRLQKALPLLEETLAKRKQKLDPHHPDTLTSMHNLAMAYKADGHMQKALHLLEETVAKRKLKLGPDHTDTLASMGNLGVAYREAGKVPDAIGLLEEVLQRARKRPGGFPALLAGFPSHLATAYEAAGQFAKAEPLYRSFLDLGQKRFGSGDVRTSGFQEQLGLNLMQQKKYAAAEALLRDCLKVRQEAQPNAWTTFRTQSLLGGSLLGQKKLAEAEPLLLQGYEGMHERASQIPAAAKVRLVEAAQGLVDLYLAWDQPDQAAAWRKTVAAEGAKLPPKSR